MIRRIAVGTLTITAVLTAVLQPVLPDGQAQAAAPASDKIRPELRQKLTARSTARSAAAVPMWVRFGEKADLTAASRIDDWTARGEAVATALQTTASAAQASVRRELDASGVRYEPFWATNALYIPSGSLALAEQLASNTEVQGLYPTVQYAVPEMTSQAAAAPSAAVEWGVSAIHADEVWSQYGAQGQGITVANIDTGVQFDHPALAKQYRGAQADGAVSNDYNWFDAAGECGAAGVPCDVNGHGTHTMGTMAGLDGIGVAPQARWIAANGCCPSDTALIESGQWMLLPTDHNGQNPDASKRPNIINNSWGSEQPSDDPFMEDITLAWAASGIFASWSNGNLGQGCDTSSAPGSLKSNFSAGAYDSSGKIADFSSRGAGQDGELKPNLSAPGVDVRSSVPGNGYAVASGTSMASPHVAGAVALLWSAAPGLVGDIDATRALLNRSAVDAPDSTCGGTSGDNNVYGEGHLDALALVDAAPVGTTGTASFSVRDGKTGAAVNGADLSVTGPVERQRKTGADGNYSMPLPPGNYTVSVTAFGYATRTATLTVASGKTSSVKLSLTPLTRSDIGGFVTDGSGQGWPLYARITVAGVPGGTYYTRPQNGQFRISLPERTTYTLTIEPVHGGYQPQTVQVSLGRHDARRDIALAADLSVCRTAGYGWRYDGTGSQLEGGLPSGWTVVDHLGNGQGWRFDDPAELGNRTGGEGVFANAQSPGNAVQVDTSLVSPVIDLSGQDAPVVGFRQDYVTIIEDADVDVSLDGGTTWQTVLTQDRSVRGPRETVVPIPQAAHQRNVRVRFHYGVGRFTSAYWQLDDLYVGARNCAPVPGGLVTGQVKDRNTGIPLSGATVRAGALTAKTVATPFDKDVADGYYSLFVPAGQRDVTASATNYQTTTDRPKVRAHEVTETEFRLPAGRLAIGPSSVTAEAGRATTRTVTLRNTGTAPVKVDVREQFVAGGPGKAVEEGHGAEVQWVEGDFSPLAFDAGAATRDQRHQDPPAPVPPWTDLANYPSRIMDNAVGEYGGLVYSVGGVDGEKITASGYVYDPAARTWSPIANLPQGRENAAGAFIGDTFYVSGGWDEGTRATASTFGYDRASNTWRSLAAGPVAAAAPGRAVLDGKLYLVGGCTNSCGMNEVRAYDPEADSWQLLAAYPEPISHLACGGVDGKLVCAGGTSRSGVPSKHTYSYDTATDTWTRKADLPTRLWGMGYTAAYDRLLVSGGSNGTAITNQGFGYDPATDTWTELPPSSNVLYRGGSACGLNRVGGSIVSGFNPVKAAEALPTYGDCVPADVPWLSATGGKTTIQPGHTATVTVRLDPAGLPRGTHDAGLWIKEDTPYLVAPVPVTLTAR